LLQLTAQAYDANLVGFYQMQHTITGWPAAVIRRGRGPATRRSTLARRFCRSFPKRVLVLSPHPDDDVISMGGTLCRLVEQGHEVHVAYEVSGAGASLIGAHHCAHGAPHAMPGRAANASERHRPHPRLLPPRKLQ